ncbi:DEAD/DEAH box helicase family protein [Candidatus Woesearchaeota archaeon]|jgi:predicted helicase|nr:DEAD/DEAH box helicase family protein [Candidatus Woesearchaeota archaeon]
MKYNKLLLSKIKTWKELEKQIEALPTTKQRGDAFEEFVFVYFNLHKTLYQISEVYMEKNIPLKYKRKFELEKKDCGVDGLIIHRDGSATGYQVKFRTDRKKSSYDELAKFWAEAKKTDNHLTIANCYSLSRLCAKHKKHLSVLVDEFDALGHEFYSEFYDFVNAKPVRKKVFRPFKYQQRMIVNTLKGFSKNDRGKLIAACGTGKTFTALRITEAMKTRTVLFLAPSLALIKQTLESWSEQSVTDFSYLCVCSDKSVSDEVDDGDITLSDFNIPVTTSLDHISAYLSHSFKGKKVIFSTYQSLDVLAKAMKKTKGFTFDLSIFDEAHRTAGAKNSGLFTLGLDDNHIRSKKRLFMTATERLLRPWIVKKAQEYNRLVFSMDDESLYGPVFDRFNFGEAIGMNVISDYKIIVAGVKEKEVYDLIKNDKLLVDIKEGTKEYYSYAQNIFRQVMLVKAMKELPIKKAVTFHSTVKGANAFIDGIGGDDISLKKILERMWSDLGDNDFYLDHINGTMSAGERKEILDLFKDSKYGVISNARCLTEGVDVPIIDSIYFVNPKSSLIDIVQACGRALRKPIGTTEKTAYFIVPILIPEGKVEAEIVNEVDFEMLHNLIQSLRDQDLRLAEWVNKINLQASKGKSHKFSKNSDSPIVLKMPENIDIKKFEEKLYIRIAEVNGEPTKFTYKTKKYGKKERKSDYKRIFTTLGDYSVESYKENLVLPTLKKFKTKIATLSMENIKINHNNVSHTRRLGLIEKEGKEFKLTPLGVQLFEDKLSFEQIFKGQMLRYYSTVKEDEGKRILFPYRACLKILLDVKSINYVEFVFGLYSMIDYSEESIAESIEGIKYLREKYSNLEILNEKNKPKVLKELNDHFGTNFSLTDIWEKKTTINNQFIYFRNHLALFEDCINCDRKSAALKKNGESKIVALLMRDQDFEKESDETQLRRGYIENIVIFMLFKL